MIEAERTPGFLHLLQMTGGASWLHMCIHHRETEGFLSSATGLDKLIAAAMVSEDTRSRLRVHGQGVMVLLKAMHLRADGVGHPEDMVSMRIWIDERRVITTREEDVDPILELAEDISQGRGPATPGDFLCDLIEVHLAEASEQVEKLEAECAAHRAVRRALERSTAVVELSLDGVVQQQKVSGTVMSDDAEVIRRLAIAGEGIAYKSMLDVSDDLRAGRLRRLLLPE